MSQSGLKRYKFFIDPSKKIVYSKSSRHKNKNYKT